MSDEDHLRDNSGPLFRSPANDQVPAAVGVKDTSVEAYLSMIHCRSKQRAMVFRAIYESRSRGVTRDELEVLTGLDHQSCSARVWEIVNAWPEVVVEGPDKRITRNGRMAFVLRVICFAPEGALEAQHVRQREASVSRVRGSRLRGREAASGE